MKDAKSLTRDIQAGILLNKATVIRSGEVGEVIGVAFYKRRPMPVIQVEYTAADGRASTDWFDYEELQLSKDAPARTDQEGGIGEAA